MALFLQSEVTLPQSVSEIQVAFPVEAQFQTVPHVEVSIINTSTDADKLILYPMLTAVSVSGFTAVFNGETDTGNYRLRWQAGDPVKEAMRQLPDPVRFRFRRLLDVPSTQTAPKSGDLIPVVDMSGPVPSLSYMTAQTFSSRMARQVDNIDNERPDYAKFVVRDGFLYVGDGTAWKKTQLQNL